jgi:phage tail sheath protein FI
MPDYAAPGVYVEELPFGAASIDGVETSTAGFVGPVSRGPCRAVRVRSFADFERAFGGLEAGSDLGYAVLSFFAGGGRDAWVAGVRPGTSVVDGLALLDAGETLGLLCLPGAKDPDVWRAALQYAETRRAFVIVDPPGVGANQVVDLRTGLGAVGRSGGAVFYPPVLITDPLTRAPRACPPSGAVAALYGRIDRSLGVWRAPAGEAALLAGVDDVAADLGEHEVAELTSSGVNCIRRLRGARIVVWGARTLASSESDWKYVNVRRFLLYLEASLDRGTQWAVFEPNDERLWQKLRVQCGLFLDGLFRAGAFPGQTPDEAYFVRLGPETTTREDIANGRLTMVVGVAPLKPAEFVIVEIARSLVHVGSESLSTSGQPSERLRLGHRPVHPEGVFLQVRGAEGWTTWTPVDDLADAGSRDRVYVLDREEGEVVFGDGVHGAIPPAGTNNVQAAYRYGLGSVETSCPD